MPNLTAIQHFSRIFTKFWDELIIGIIAGLVVYYGLTIKNGFKAGLFIFLAGLILVILYSLFIWSGERYKWEENIKTFLKRYWKLITYLIVAGYVYSGIHEFLHHKLLNYFGYLAQYCWTCIPTRVNLITHLDQVLIKSYFISILAPYILSGILLIILLFAFLCTKRKILVLFALTPFLDTFVNSLMGIPLAYITGMGNDFLNLFRLGVIWQTWVFMLIPLLLFVLIYIYYRKYKRTRQLR